jgi:hypothetical protein
MARHGASCAATPWRARIASGACAVSTRTATAQWHPTLPDTLWGPASTAGTGTAQPALARNHAPTRTLTPSVARKHAHACLHSNTRTHTDLHTDSLTQSLITHALTNSVTHALASLAQELNSLSHLTHEHHSHTHTLTQASQSTQFNPLTHSTLSLKPSHAQEKQLTSHARTH